MRVKVNLKYLMYISLITTTTKNNLQLCIRRVEKTEVIVFFPSACNCLIKDLNYLKCS